MPCKCWQVGENPSSDPGQKRANALKAEFKTADCADAMAALSPQENRLRLSKMSQQFRCKHAKHGMGSVPFGKGPAYYAEPVKAYFNLTDKEEF